MRVDTKVIVILILLLPLCAFILSTILVRTVTIKNKFLKYGNVFLLGLTLILTCLLLKIKEVYQFQLFEFVSLFNSHIFWGAYVDQLTVWFLIMIALACVVLSIYSLSYKSVNANAVIAMVALSEFFMITIVLSPNFIQLLFGLEALSICSYFIIRFGYEKQILRRAALEKMVINKLADVFLIIGAFALYMLLNTFNFSELNTLIAKHNFNTNIIILSKSVGVIDLVCLMISIGCAARCAQFLFHNWFIDITKGAIPTIALMQFITVVPSGVFILLRLSGLFNHSALALSVIGIIGAFTVIFTASMAMLEKNIKKIIALTISNQLGYVFFAYGLAAYQTSLFYLCICAFINMLMILSAGNIIYVTGGRENITNMSNRVLEGHPLNCVVLLTAFVIVSNISMLGGYLSKNMILELAYAAGSFIGEYLYVLGIIGLFCTGFYCCRVIAMILYEDNEEQHKTIKHRGGRFELPFYVKIIFAILFVLAVIYSVEYFFIGTTVKDINVPYYIKVLPVISSFSALCSVYIIYIYKPELSEMLSKKFDELHVIVLNKYYINEIYNIVFVQSFKNISSYLNRFERISWIEKWQLNRVFNLIGWFSGYMQAQSVYGYVLAVMFAIMLIFLFCMTIYFG